MLEGIVSKRAGAAYAPANRGIWFKVKRLYREEFVVVGWTDPEARRPWLGALLHPYYDPDGRLVYAPKHTCRISVGVEADLRGRRSWFGSRPRAT